MIHRHEAEDILIDHVDVYLKLLEFFTSPQIDKACKQLLTATTDLVFGIGPHLDYDREHGVMVVTGARNNIGAVCTVFHQVVPTCSRRHNSGVREDGGIRAISKSSTTNCR
jgi:hypothetical protein